MRLAQLARKLQVRPSEIVDFLSRHQIETEEGFNARLEADHVSIIVGHFAPALLAEIQQEEEEEPVTSVVEEVVVETVSVPEVKAEPVIEEVEVQQATVTETVNEESKTDEVIKAAKVELPGLKVLGKIELPEAKKKEEPKKEETAPATEGAPVARANRNPRPERKNRQPRRDEPWKNPIALQREKEAREAEEKRQEKLQREKELRTMRYQKKVSKNMQPSRSRLINEPVEEVITTTEAPAPKTWFGRFLRWLKK